MAFLEAIGITKKFPGVIALEEVGLKLEKGQIHCVVGENGAGKSTLVKILTGLYKADEGQLIINGDNVNYNKAHTNTSIAYVPQELSLFNHMTVAENLFIPFDRSSFTSVVLDIKSVEAATQPILDKFDMKVKPSDVVKNIPVCEQQLLQVARAISKQNCDILILDEPTTSLTRKETERLFNVIRALKAEGKAIVFISHKLDEVFALGDIVTVLRNGKTVGSSETKKVTSHWIIMKMSGEEIDIDKKYQPVKKPGGKLLEVKGLTGRNFSNISFDVNEGEIVGFAGLIGAGRSEIMQTIFGYLPEKSGEVFFAGTKWKFRDTSYSIRNGVIYLTEERKTHGILPFLSVNENVSVLLPGRISTGGVISGGRDVKISKKVIREYDVKTSSHNTRITNLSGGNQQKILIGRSMESSPRLIILDEPTKGIDVKTKEEIYSMMKNLAEKERVGIILVSSELEELVKCSNRIIPVYNGRKSGELSGNQISSKNLLSAIMGLQNENGTRSEK